MGVNYTYGPYNKFNEVEQWVRITEGCPHKHEYCYEPQEIKVFGTPEIVRNDVKIMDMNLLCKPEALSIIQNLGKRRVNDKVIYYELICGIDYRFLTLEIATALKESRFRNIRLAWDMWYDDQYKIVKTIKTLIKAGYKTDLMTVFMVCNWKIPYRETLKKLDLCKIWRIKIADCWFDNQTSPNIVPVHWHIDAIKDFRKRVRLHNQLVRFGIDPNVKKGDEDQGKMLF